MGTGHRLDTDARGIPAVTATTVRATAPWTSSRTKVRREAAARLARLQAAGLDGTEWHMPRAVVPKANPRRRMTTNQVKVYIDPNRIQKAIGHRDHDYTVK